MTLPALDSGKVSSSCICSRSFAGSDSRKATRFASGRLSSTDEHTSGPPISRIGMALSAWGPAAADEMKAGAMVGSTFFRQPCVRDPSTSRACSSVSASRAWAPAMGSRSQ